jgi:hypothetical protein
MQGRHRPGSLEAAMTLPSAAASVGGLGALLHARRFSPKGYYLAAGFMFLAPLALAAWLLIADRSKHPGDNAFLIGIVLFWGTVGSLPFLIKGYRKSGLAIEAYERGMRFIPRRREAATFAYQQVAELRRQMFKGMLASLTLVLADGRTFKIDVQGRHDLELVQDVLSRFGEGRWEADRGFRLI